MCSTLAPNLHCEAQDDHRYQRVRRTEEAQPEQRVDGDDVGELVAGAEQRADRRANDDARQGLVARDGPLKGRHSQSEAAFLAELLCYTNGGLKRFRLRIWRYRL